ncbi:AraC family transcriptional regulator [Photobacterium aquae]|uniref:AraC family transcriptional regulator n=1 Tax=Photobacterium aquae TaxID=1195763 RepID=A0A0J1H160_9GAMM|nr:AraC family transcriptional regulator [Photobacterium aquae]KLV05534.1 AraC family transcriptional regulator [Photobacterium aquae]
MYHIITESLNTFNGQLIHLCTSENTPPEGAYQVNFNRLEILLDGDYDLIVDGKYDHQPITLKPNEMIYIPANSWSKPTWDKSCRMISILFGRSQVGFSYIEYVKGEGFVEVVKHSMPLPSSMSCELVINALSCIGDDKKAEVMANSLAQALILYCRALLTAPQQEKTSRSERLYRNICIYVQENFHKDITRITVADRFGISSAHVSRLFNQEGSVKYADYVTYVRLDRAKFMLKTYSFKIDEIARRCGFKDTNYFCRVFKQKTGKTPSEYRLNAA